MRVNPTFTGFEEFCTAGDKTEPSVGLKSSGYLPLEMLPAQHFNWLINRASKGVSESQLYVDNINKELNTLLTKAGISPNNGTDQIDAAILALYNEYDIIIDSQTKFNLWLNNTTQAYKRVYIRQGTYDLPSVPPVGNAFFTSALCGTKRIVCEQNVTIQAITLACSFDVTIFELSVSDLDAPLFNGITFFGTNNLNGGLTVFKNMRNLVNCRALSGGNVSSSVKAFDGCSFLQDCVFSSGGNITGDIYNYCTNLFGCAILSSTSLAASSKRGFFACKGLIRCTFTAGTGGAYTGFSYCEDLTACAYTNSSGGSATGFANCLRLAQCRVAINSSSSGTCFSYCEDMSTCSTAFDSSCFSTSLDNCTRIANFSAVYASAVSGVAASPIRFCTNMNNIRVNVSAGTLNASSSEFIYMCERVSNCDVYLACSIGATLYVFASDKFLNNCRVQFTNSSSATIRFFSSCTNLSLCYVSVSVTTCSSLFGFWTCSRMASCVCEIDVATSISTGITGFYSCTECSSCVALNDGTCSTAGSFSSEAFAICTRLSACRASALSNSSNMSAAFSSCTYVIGCAGVGTNNGSGAGYGFRDSTRCQQNGPVSASKTSTYSTSYADTATNLCADTATGGYNRV